MKVSRNWLQTYFEKEIPSAEKLAELFAMHAFEVESVEEIQPSLNIGKDKKITEFNLTNTDFILDVKILPDRAHYDLSHKGIAQEIHYLTKLPIKERFAKELKDTIADKPVVKILRGLASQPVFCRRYVARIVELRGEPTKGGSQDGGALSKGNAVPKESPEWLKTSLEAIGQRSINPIVDITNYVMYDIGQPLHAFDADKVKGGLIVRPATAGEKIVLLDGRGITLTASDNVIADEEGALVIAGAKGGKRAEISESTKRIIIESANFDPTAVRRTSTKYDIRSDSSKRFENEITAELAMNGMNNVCALIQEMIPNVKFGPIVDEYPVKAKQSVIDFDPAYLKERLGVEIPLEEAQEILERMGVEIVIPEKDVSSTVLSEDKLRRESSVEPRKLIIGNPASNLNSNPPGNTLDSRLPSFARGFGRALRGNDNKSGDDTRWILTVPYERLDLVIADDVVEEVGRVYGYDKIMGILPPPPYTKSANQPPVINIASSVLPLYFLSEKIKSILVDLGFSEVSLYTLVEKGDIEAVKPLAKDKAFARSNLSDGMIACVERNVLNADLLGIEMVKIFEIGHIFTSESEQVHLAIGVAEVKKVKGLKAENILAEAMRKIESELEVTIHGKIVNAKNGAHSIIEIDLEPLVKSSEVEMSFEKLGFGPASSNHYQKFSAYPFIVRDVAVFVPDPPAGGNTSDNVWKIIEKGIGESKATELLVRHALFDTFKKEGKISYAFRLIFQSFDRTLTDEEVSKIMEMIYNNLKNEGWEVR